MLIFLYLVFSPAMLYLGITSLYDELALQNRGVTVDALLSDWDVENGEYSVRYRFRAGGSNTWYSCADRLGRRNLWCPITAEQWYMTQASGRVPVIYLPDNPWINRPVRSTIGMSDVWAGTCAGLIPWMLLLIYLIYKDRLG